MQFNDISSLKNTLNFHKMCDMCSKSQVFPLNKQEAFEEGDSDEEGEIMDLEALRNLSISKQVTF